MIFESQQPTGPALWPQCQDHPSLPRPLLTHSVYVPGQILAICPDLTRTKPQDGVYDRLFVSDYRDRPEDSDGGARPQ